MPKLARSDTKPCPLASLKKGPEILAEKGGARGGQNKRDRIPNILKLIWIWLLYMAYLNFGLSDCSRVFRLF